jgi:hypothetical protein
VVHTALCSCFFITLRLVFWGCWVPSSHNFYKCFNIVCGCVSLE